MFVNVGLYFAYELFNSTVILADVMQGYQYANVSSICIILFFA